MKRKKHLLLIILLFISIGFAVLTSNLSINGIASFTDASFDVHFENATIKDKNIDDGSITIGDDTVSITSTGTFEKPGDYIDTSFYVINSGTMDASLNTLSVTGLSNELKNYFTYTLKYDIGGSNVARGDILRAGQGRKINLHIEYKYDVEQLATVNSLNMTITMNYINPKKTSTSTVWNYEYTGGEQYYIAQKSGNYKLEAWGAQGGTVEEYQGGYGAYTTGIININKNEKIYINVGNQPKVNANNNSAPGGYNGGGAAETKSINDIAGPGGGASSVSFKSREIKTYTEEEKNQIIMIAGAGGGAYKYLNNNYQSSGGSAGGITGSNSPWDGLCVNRSTSDGTKSNQTTGGGISYCGIQTYVYNGSLGQGGIIGTTNPSGKWYAGGGSGYYGGGAGYAHGANGGSSYIGYEELTSRVMYCYNCEESTVDKTRTISTANVSETPTSNYAKIGDGFVRITYLGKN